MHVGHVGGQAGDDAAGGELIDVGEGELLDVLIHLPPQVPGKARGGLGAEPAGQAAADQRQNGHAHHGETVADDMVHAACPDALVQQAAGHQGDQDVKRHFADDEDGRQDRRWPELLDTAGQAALFLHMHTSLCHSSPPRKRILRSPGGRFPQQIALELLSGGQELVDLLRREPPGEDRLRGGDAPLCLVIQRLSPRSRGDALHPGVLFAHGPQDQPLVLQPLQQPGGRGAADAEDLFQILLIDLLLLIVAEIADQNAFDLCQHPLGMLCRAHQPPPQKIGQGLDLKAHIPFMLHGNTSFLLNRALF